MTAVQEPSTRNVWAAAERRARRELAAYERGRRQATEQQVRVWRRILVLADQWRCQP